MTAESDVAEPRRTDGRTESGNYTGPENCAEAEDFPEAVVEGVSQFLGKPRARGWIHVYAAIIATVAGAALVSVSWAVDSTRAGIATLIYTCTIVAMFTVSGTYHRVHWTSRRAHTWMKRLDHSMIFVFIAGSYTPFALLALPESDGWLLFWIVWGGALAGVLLKMCWPSAPAWVGVPLYLLLGWVAAWFIGPITQQCRRCGVGSADRRWRALQPRRGAVRAEVAQSMAAHIRPPRVLPRLHRGRGDLPLHRNVVRRVLVAPTRWRRLRPTSRPSSMRSCPRRRTSSHRSARSASGCLRRRRR